MSGNLPHVTSLLKSAGLIDTTFFTDYDLDRGSALHTAAQFLDEGDLNWETVHPDVLGRLRQYQRFLDEVKPEILGIEEPVVNEVLRYCGRIDRRVKINGAEGILDLKGPSQSVAHRLQLAMYADCFIEAKSRWALYLSDDAYRLVEFKNRDDYRAARALLNLHNWRIRNDPEYIKATMEELKRREEVHP